MNAESTKPQLSRSRLDALHRTSSRDVTDWWSTAISDIEPNIIRLRGYPIEQLIDCASFAQVVWLLVRGELPSAQQASLFERALVAAVDHGPQAPSVAAARMAATCGVGLHGAISTGVGLLGDVHGGAGQQCMELFERVDRESRADDLVAVVDRIIGEYREDGCYLPGFGHRFHTHDPRRDPLLRATRHHAAVGTISGRYVAIAEELERRLAQGRNRPVPINIDGATAVVYAELGFAPELGRGLFILSRSVGILAHSWEESQGRRRIKGPIPPPLLPTYTGVPQRFMAEGNDTAK